MDRSLRIALSIALALAGCGGAPRAEPIAVAPEPEPEVEATPPAPATHRIALRTFLPVYASGAGLMADGTWMCRQTWHVAPPEDSAHCLADGLGITASVLHVIDPAGTSTRYLERAIELRRITDCGNGEEAIRRPPRALRDRVAPDLATAMGSALVHADQAHFASCLTPDLDVVITGDVEVAQRGSFARLQVPESATTSPEVVLVRGETEIARWTLEALPPSSCAEDAGAHEALALEVLCAGTTEVVTASVIAPASACADRATASQLEFVPCAIRDGATGLRSLRRWRIDTASGAITELPIDTLRFDPSAGER